MTTPVGNKSDKLLVSFILFANFDVDQGSVMKEQYPRNLIPPPVSEFVVETLSYSDIVANMMHPDGSQRQEWDHNYFLLHRPESELEKEALSDWELLDDSNSKSVTLQSFNSIKDTESTLYALNCINCNRNKNVRRGATIQALAILSEYPSFSLSDGWSSDEKINIRDCMEDLFVKLNTIDCKNAYQVLASINDLRFSSKPFFLKTSINYLNEDFPLCLPLSSFNRAFSSGSIVSLIRRFGFSNVIQLYKSILEEQNILFVGYGVVSSILCKIVISCSFLAPIIPNLITERIFPYVNLNDFTFTQTKGFIAGTNNPMMKESCNFDIVVDLEKNSFTKKTNDSFQKSKPSLKSFGKNLLEETTKLIQQDCFEVLKKKLEFGIITLRCDENWVRRQFLEHSIILTEVALGIPEVPKIIYESYNESVGNIITTFWFKNYIKDYETQQQILNRINSSCRHIWYSLRGYHLSKDRSTYICPALEQLVQIVDDDYTLLLVSQRLIFYFGNVDLSDAIEFIQVNDYNFLSKVRELNVRLLTLYSDDKILLALQCTV